MVLSWVKDTVIIQSKEVVSSESGDISTLWNHSDWSFDTTAYIQPPTAGYYLIPFDTNVSPIALPLPLPDPVEFVCMCVVGDQYNYGGCVIQTYLGSKRGCETTMLCSGYCNGVLIHYNYSTNPISNIVLAKHGGVLVKANVVIE